MQARVFLAVNALILIMLILRLIKSRQQPAPTPLQMTETRTGRPSAKDSFGEKSLNCYFMHNGLMMDAFEILGLPSGASREVCYRAYVDLRRTHKNPEVIENAWLALQGYFN
jgi:hypothetical protein